jgi:hypothetical protein
VVIDAPPSVLAFMSTSSVHHLMGQEASDDR